MKKILNIFIFLMFALLLNVKADEVNVESIELVDKTNSSIILSEPTLNNFKINFNLQFNEVGDYALYKIKINNNLDTKLFFNTRNHINEKIKYEYYFEDRDNYISANTFKYLYVKVSYPEVLQDSDYNKNNIYKETFKKVYTLTESEVDPDYTTTTTTTIPSTTLAKSTSSTSKITSNKTTTTKPSIPIGKKTNKIINSPQTDDILHDYIVLFAIALVFLLDTLYIILYKNKTQNSNILVSSVSILLILLSVVYKKAYAFDKTIFEIETNVEVLRYPEMAESCTIQSDHRAGINCIDWNSLLGSEMTAPSSYWDAENSSYNIDILISTTQEMDTKYIYNGKEYLLDKTYDISKWNNDLVILRIYKNENDYLYIICGKKGVKLSNNAQYLFSGEIYNNNGTRSYTILSKARNINLKNLDTSNVDRMAWEFFGLGVYSQGINLDLSSFDTSNVTNMNSMFSYVGASSSGDINIDLSSFNTSNVYDMSFMFSYFGQFCSSNINIDLSSFNTSNVTKMTNMFSHYGYFSRSNINLDLSTFDTTNVTDMYGMFEYFGAHSINVNLNLSSWKNSKVKYMSNMFEFFGNQADSVNLNLTNFTTPKVTNMSNMFAQFGEYLENIDLDLSTFDTTNVTDMSSMFLGFGSNIKVLNLDLKNFNTSNVTDMSGMFNKFGWYSDNINLNINSFNTSKVTNMYAMFEAFGEYSNEDIILDLSSFDTTNVTNMGYMFNHFGGKTIYVINNWNTSKVTDSGYMFTNCSKLVGGKGAHGLGSYLNYARIDNSPTEPGYFTLKTA